ncbi:MAG: adenylosuccinate synthase [Bacteroidota bacterium]
MKVDVLLGLQWGDEGKGKIVDVLTPDYDIIARFQGGPNAGHTLEIAGDKHVLHTIPSGIFHSEKINIIGNGVILDPLLFQYELEKLKDKGITPENNLLISKKAHLILPSHRLLDAAYESAKGNSKIGSTLKGIGPTYTDKTARTGIQVKDILNENFAAKYETLKKQHLNIMKSHGFDYEHHQLEGMPFAEYEKKWLAAAEKIKTLKVINTENYINKQLNSGKSVLAEGAQGTLLDIDFGSYPFVTSSNTITAGVCSGLGIAPSKIGNVYGIVKAYCTRVGSGPFPTELFDEDGRKLRDAGHEYGATTGRPRRCGWLDINALKYAIMLNGVTDLVMTKADVLSAFDVFKVCDGYKSKDGQLITEFDIDDAEITPAFRSFKGWNVSLDNVMAKAQFPKQLDDYIKYIEEETGVPVSILSVGADRDKTITLKYH